MVVSSSRFLSTYKNDHFWKQIFHKENLVQEKSVYSQVGPDFLDCTPGFVLLNPYPHLTTIHQIVFLLFWFIIILFKFKRLICQDVKNIGWTICKILLNKGLNVISCNTLLIPNKKFDFYLGQLIRTKHAWICLAKVRTLMRIQKKLITQNIIKLN